MSDNSNFIQTIVDFNGSQIPCVANSSSFLISNPTTISEMTNGVQLKEHHVPHRLVCIQMLCPYTGCGNIKEDIGLECISFLFGIRCCKKHRKVAQADCATWMRKNGMFHISEEFLKKMELKNRKFQVKRSNGNIEDNWIINTPEESFRSGILINTNKGTWSISMLGPERDISKTVELSELSLDWLEEYIDSIPDDEYVLYPPGER
jgi:hypothetical protein